MNRSTFLLLPLIYLFIPVSAYTPPVIGNPARTEAKIDQVYSQFGLSGDGVIVAMIERGIDYRHPDFIDENGQTRIAYIFDLIDDSGASDPDNPYGAGTIYSEAEINASLTNGGAPLTTDRFGHGTACTGIAAGNGSAITDNTFRGVAHNATIISVKVTHDYFPPFDDQPGQAGVFDANDIPIALEFVKDKAAELGLPCVTLINLGSIGGPTDGTSTICQAMDAFVDAGNVLVCGVGDDGGNANFALGNLEQDETIELKFNKGEAGFLRLDLWYDGDDRIDVGIKQPDGMEFGPFSGPANNAQATSETLNNITLYHRGADVDFFGATSNRRELLIDFTGQTGEYTVQLTGTNISEAIFQASLNPATHATENYFTTYASPQSSINDYASAFNVITPGDYVVQNEWTDLSGNFQDIVNQGESGELWIGSSWGPTHDFRLGLDFVAPGEVLFGAYSPDTWYGHFSQLLVEGGEGNYGIQNAVSAAAPLTTGVIAMMLEQDPDLTAEEIRTILQETAREDSFTGSTPNNLWGHGKLDALAAVKEVAGVSAIAEPQIAGVEISMQPNPVEGILSYQIGIAESEILEVVIHDLTGQQLIPLSAKAADSIDLQGLTSGTYLLSVRTKSAYITKKFVKQ